MMQAIGPHSTREITKEMVLYERVPYFHEILVTLLVRGILNVSEIVRVAGKAYSIAQPLNMDGEKLKLEEILADICLIEVLTGNSWDRLIVPVSNDIRNRHAEHITWNNCRVYHNGTYSVFDIDSLEFRILGSDDILFEFYLSLSRMYGIEHIPQKSQFILEYELPNEIFGERVKNRTQHLLERYDTVEWKKLFLRQIAHAASDYRNVSPETIKKLWTKEDIWFDEDTELYENFIWLLRNIYDIFSTDSYVLSDYIARNRRVLIHETKATLVALWRNIKSLFEKILWIR